MAQAGKVTAPEMFRLGGNSGGILVTVLLCGKHFVDVDFVIQCTKIYYSNVALLTI